MSVTIPVSIGELFDKITILEIKMSHISASKKKLHVIQELNLLRSHGSKFSVKPDSLKALKKVNETLWDAEDKIREKEKEGHFGDGFVELARSIYRLNDQRARIKLDINTSLNSKIIEVKSYV